MDGIVGDDTGTLTSIQLDPDRTNPILIRGSTCLEHPGLQTKLSPQAISPSVQEEFSSHLSERFMFLNLTL